MHVTVTIPFRMNTRTSCRPWHQWIFKNWLMTLLNPGHSTQCTNGLSSTWDKFNFSFAFLHGTCPKDWNLHLSSLEELRIWFFAANRLDYGQNVPEYIARMYDSEETNPQIWNFFKESGLTVQTGKIPFTAIGVDQAQEHIDKIHKGLGGFSGITTSPEAQLRYCLSTPELARLSSETEIMLSLSVAERSLHWFQPVEIGSLRKEY